jgi:5-methylcytosine-specific restriction endonuclease McrA
MKYRDAVDGWQVCPHCHEEVKVSIELMGHDGPHYAKAICPSCSCFLGWVGKPENDNKRTKSSKFTPDITYCEICGRRQFGSKEVLEVHHKIPISEGGSDERDNLLFVCTACHKMCHFLRLYLNTHLSHYYGKSNESD